MSGDRGNPLFTLNLYLADKQTRQKEVLDVKDDHDLCGELDEADRRIRELRGARHAITVDLEQAIKEADRLRKHLVNSEKEER